MKSGIYRIQNIRTGDFYIGSTKDFSKRMVLHYNLLRRKKHHNARLQNSFNKHGESVFIFGIVEICEPEVALERESYYFQLWKPKYNIERTPGRPTLGRQLAESTRQKIGMANSVNRMTESHFKKFREASEAYMIENHPMRGKKHRQESRKKMSESRIAYFEKLRLQGLTPPGPKKGQPWTQARRDAQIARKIR